MNMSFSMKTEKENKLSFLDIEIIGEKGKFTTKVYQKTTFSGVYSNFHSFLPCLIVLFSIIFSAVIFHPGLTTSVFSLMKTKSIHWKLKKAC